MSSDAVEFVEILSVLLNLRFSSPGGEQHPKIKEARL
jgi:hypothetical protein